MQKILLKEKKIDTKKIKSILIFELHSIGGTLLVTPVFRYLKKIFPECKLAVVSYPSSFQILSENKYIDEIIIYKKGFGSIPALFKVLTQRYDLVLDYLCKARSIVVTLLAGAKYRIGMDTNFRNFFYSHIADRSADIYVAEFNLNYLSALNVSINDFDLDLFYKDEDINFADKFIKQLKPHNKLIGISPTGTWYTKKWMEEKFAELCDILIKNYKCVIILLWGPNEKEVVQKVADLCKYELIIAPPTNLHQLAALISKMDLLITNDTANKHIAVSQHTPTITTYGATKPSSWEPPENSKHLYIQKTNIPCVPCDKTTCSRNLECLTEIMPQEVFELTKKFL